MNQIPKDIYYKIFTELNLQDIVKLCNLNKKFKEFFYNVVRNAFFYYTFI